MWEGGAEQELCGWYPRCEVWEAIPQSCQIHDHRLSAHSPPKTQTNPEVNEHVTQDSMSVPTLRQCSNVDTFIHPSNIVWTSRHRCVDVVPTFYCNPNPNFATKLSQLWPMLANIQAMLCEFCGNVTPCCENCVAMSLSKLGTNIETTFRQCCVNVVWTSVPNIGDQHWDNIQVTLCERWVNVVWTLLPNIGDQRLDKVQAMLCESCINIDAQCCNWLVLHPEWQFHSSLNFLHPYICTITSTNIYE